MAVRLPKLCRNPISAHTYPCQAVKGMSPYPTGATPHLPANTAAGTGLFHDGMAVTSPNTLFLRNNPP